MKKSIHWLHWLLYGEWKIEVHPKRACKREKSVEREMVATPFISTGFGQKLHEILIEE